MGLKLFQKLESHTNKSVIQTSLTSDIDIDYLPEAREKIKEYVSSKYGSEHVCSVGLWQSYNFKLAMQDAAKALGKDKAPVFKITKMLPDDFDDRPIDDIMKALSSENVKMENPELSELSDYYKTEDGKKVVNMASRMVGLLKTQGKHAAGMIISNVNLFDSIPMSKLGGLWTSQWTEGYSPQLSKFGLIKWDVLGLKTMSYIWKCIDFVKKNDKDLGLPKCTLCGGNGFGEGGDNSSYGDKCLECAGSGVSMENVDFNMKEALKLANDLRTESVFQFETDLAKSILKKGGVKSFNDLLIYTSLGRPGPLPLIDEYIERRDDKNEKWKKQEHPEVVELFKDTFGIVVFQETLQLYWTKICGFTVPEAEAARKAVAKKWGEQLEKVMRKAEIGAAKRIGQDEAIKWNKRIETFGRYAFNRCLDADEMIEDPITGEITTIEDVYLNKRKFHLLSYQEGNFVSDLVINVHHNGTRPVYEVTFTNDAKLRVTKEHKFLNEFGHYETLQDLSTARIMCLGKERNCGTCHIKSVKFIGFRKVYSPEMQSESHNYLIRPEVGQPIHKNSHAVSYTIIAYLCLYLKAKFPTEWWAAVLSICDDRDKISNYVMTSRNEGIKYAPLRCDDLTRDFIAKHDVIVPGLLGIKGIGEKAITNVLANVGVKYESVDHFVEKNGKNKILMERLIKLGAFDHLFPNRSALWMWYLLKYSTCKQSKEAKAYFRDKLGLAEKAKLNVSFEDVAKLSPRWGLRKILSFEKDFFGYHFTSPMSCYKFSKEKHMIGDAAETGMLEVIVQDSELKQTKTNKKYLKLTVTDGVASAVLSIWDLDIIDDIEDVNPGSGIRVEVKWDEKFNSFSLKRNTRIMPLDRSD